MKDMYVLEYSQIQRAVHVDTLERILSANQQNILNGIVNCYVPIFVFESREEAIEYAETFKSILRLSKGEAREKQENGQPTN